jgi:flagellar protein FliO/FliZ
MTGFAVRIVFSLVVVLALMWALARLARGPLSRGGALGGLTVVARQQLTRNAGVAVVRLADRGLLLGVTDQQVTLLGETDLAELEQLAVQVAARRRPSPFRGRTPVSDVDALAGGVHIGSTVDGSVGNGHDGGRLAGSILSRRTWAQTLEFLRERTARQP